MVDAYRQPYIPFYLATREFFELVRDRLAPGGVVIVNAGHPEGNDDLEKVLGRDDGRGLSRPCCATRSSRRTRCWSASEAPVSARTLLRAARASSRRSSAHRRATEARRIGPRLPGGEVYTDDRAPVEWLIDRSILGYAVAMSRRADRARASLACSPGPLGRASSPSCGGPRRAAWLSRCGARAKVAPAREDHGHRAARLARADRGRRSTPAERRASAWTRAARELAGEMRIPGFRKGKVPAADGHPARRARGRASSRRCATRCRSGTSARCSSRGQRRSATRSSTSPSSPAAGEQLTFSIEVGVRPKAKLGDYKGLEVGRAEPEVPDEAIEAELERLREGFASPQAGRAGGAAEGDLSRRLQRHDRRRAVRGRPEARDQLVELGLAARWSRASRRRWSAPAAGDERTIEVTFPDDYRAEQLAGKHGDASRSRSRRCARRSCPSSTTSSPPTPRSSTRSTSCATDDRASGSARRSRTRPRTSSARRRSTPPSRRPTSTSPTRSSALARRGIAGARRAPAHAPRRSTPRPSCRCRRRPREELIADVTPEAERALRARGDARGDRRRRGDRGLRRRAGRGAGAGRGRQRTRASCSSGCGGAGATTSCARTCGCARPPTWSSTRRSRSRSHRPRRARRSGRRRRSERGHGGGQAADPASPPPGRSGRPVPDDLRAAGRRKAAEPDR